MVRVIGVAAGTLPTRGALSISGVKWPLNCCRPPTVVELGSALDRDSVPDRPLLHAATSSIELSEMITWLRMIVSPFCYSQTSRELVVPGESLEQSLCRAAAERKKRVAGLGSAQFGCPAAAASFAKVSEGTS
jgi:hypothetical protein